MHALLLRGKAFTLYYPLSPCPSLYSTILHEAFGRVKQDKCI